jgi:membrane fusion protein, multidrug efflux system
MNPHSELPSESDHDPSPHPGQAALPPGPAAPLQLGAGEPPRKGRGWLVFLVLVLAAGAAYYFFVRKGVGSTASATTDAKVGKSSGGGSAIPVVGARARRGNIGVYYSGTGSVTPVYTDTVKSRVDGQLMTVHYTEGQMVKKGDPLIEIDPRPYQAAVDQAEGSLARDQALLANAKIDQTRYELLVPQKAVPEQMLATQKALVQQYEGTVKNDQGVVDAAKVNLVYCHITADISGLVGLRLVDPGNIVHATDTNGLVVITQIDPITVIFTLSESQLPTVLQKMHAGQMLEVDAWDSSMSKKLAQGTLTTVDNQIDQTTGTVRLRSTFDNKDNVLFPYQFVNARLLVQEKTGVVLLNQAAIQRNTNATFVFLVQPDSTVITRNITVGTTEGEDAEITSGLAPGDVAVLTGADKLSDGARVGVQIPGEQPQPGSAQPKSNQATGRAQQPGGKGK